MSDNQRQETADERAETATGSTGHEAAHPEQQQEAEQQEVLEGELDAGGTEDAGGEAEQEGDDPESLRQRIGELEEALAEAERRAQDNWDQAVRVRAELENTQRRAQKDVEQAKLQAQEKVINDLLQVKDSLEMGVRAAEDAEADREKLLEGSQLTLKMLEQVFERFEIEELNPQGERFNPEYHEAMSTQPSDEQEPNTVLHVIQKGYRLKERLLRPALVVVAKQGEGASGGDASGGSGPGGEAG